MATRQDEPVPGCKASKEELLNSKDPLNAYDDCPICEKRGVLCEVANHPSRPLPATAVLALPPSPRCESSCFVLLTSNDPPAVKGTAFAVGDDLLLTACHCISKSQPYYIAGEVSRLSNGNFIYPKGRCKVKAVAIGDASFNHGELDYAVLQLVRERNPAHPLISRPLTPLPIYSPDVMMEERVKSYFAFGANSFNEASRHTCGIAVHDYEKISFVTSHHIEIDPGLNAGCSGGPYVINDKGIGKVVAIHLESSNDIPDVNDSNAPPQSTDNTSEITLLRDTISVVSNTHSSVAQGLIVAKCVALCAVLRSKGVVI